jgi:hypothetical protein
VVLNMTASWESLLAHAIPGATQTEGGSITQWIKQGFALVRGTRYQLHLLKGFRKITEGDNLVEFGRTLTSFTKVSSRVSRALIGSQQWRGRVYQKMNGLPEFTPFTTGRHSIFIKGGYSPHGESEGLTGFRRLDEAKANAAGSVTPSNATWHHHEVMGIMQLVPTDLNNGIGGPGIRHDGGTAFWQLMKNIQYKE